LCKTLSMSISNSSIPLHFSDLIFTQLTWGEYDESELCKIYIFPSIFYMFCLAADHTTLFFIIGIQPLGRSGRRPELSQATGMALVHCILGKFLGVVCHCFLRRLDVPTFATRCPHVHHDARDPSGRRWNCGREYCPVILPKWRLPRHLGIFYMPQIYDMGPTALLRIFSSLKIRWLRPGLNPRT
jgi:hypothetical protein